MACLLNERQRTTKRVRSGAGRLRGAKAFVKNGALRILRSPVYAGYMASQGEVFEGEQEPIVKRKTWSAVQVLLAGGAGPRRDHGRNGDYFLRGILRCACCGSALTPASTRRGSVEYRYYRSVKKEKEGREACPPSPLPAEAIESHVVEQIREATAGAVVTSGPLRMLLGGAGIAYIAYVFLGRELGARPPGKDLVVDGRYSYARLAARPEFAAGIDAVLEMKRGSRVALMCAEKDPTQCPLVCALRAASRLTPVVSSRSPAPSDSLSPDIPFPLPNQDPAESSPVQSFDPCHAWTAVATIRFHTADTALYARQASHRGQRESFCRVGEPDEHLADPEP